MVAPLIASGLVSAGSSLLGGFLNSRSQRRQNKIDQKNHRARFEHLREDAEKAGFNPLTAMASGSISPPTGVAPQMGSAIASAGMVINDAISGNEQAKMDAARLEMERDTLRKALEKATLQPNVGGVYSRRSHFANAPSRAMRSHTVLGGLGASTVSEVPFRVSDKSRPMDFNNPSDALGVITAEGIEVSNPDMPVELEAELSRSVVAGHATSYVADLVERNEKDFGHTMDKAFAVGPYGAANRFGFSVNSHLRDQWRKTKRAFFN